MLTQYHVCAVILAEHPELLNSLASLSKEQLSQMTKLLALVPQEPPGRIRGAGSPYARDAAPPISPYLQVTLRSERP